MAAASGTLLLSHLSSCTLATSKKPNILFLLADDQRPDTIAAWGNSHIQTPNIDSLVRNGFSFRRNYCMGSPHGAVCIPSRAMINSGRAYFKIDLNLNGVETLGEILRRNGYKTFATGKWHNGQESFLRSFEEGKAVFFGGMADHTRVPVADTTPDGKVVNKRTAEKFSSECFANAAEHSMGCPLIFSGSNIPKNKYSHAFTYLLDVFPTVLNFAGIQPAADIDGQNLQPVWEGKKSGVRDAVFLAFGKGQRAIHKCPWKLIRYPQINYTQLFNLQDDPDELYNLAEEPEQVSRVKELMNLLKTRQQKFGDTQALSSANPRPMKIDLSGHERKPDRHQPEWIRKKYFGE
ncbi:MAG: sulfatase-like hydrolase/transferase [Actinobacteria bacterium]|nr:sulfatase-like hydrolase/transferase [Actinomycetota bacterium]